MRLHFALLHGDDYALYYGVLAVLLGVVVSVDIDAEESSKAVPECGAEGAKKCFEYLVTALVGFAFDEFHEHFGLRFGEFFQHGLVLVEHRRFHRLEVLLALFLCGEGLYILVSFKQCGGYEPRVGERAFHVAHGAPIELLLLPVLEFQRGIYGYIVEYQHQNGVAGLAYGMIFPAVNLAHGREVVGNLLELREPGLLSRPGFHGSDDCQ